MILDLSDYSITHLRLALLWYQREASRMSWTASEAAIRPILQLIEKKLEKINASDQLVR